MGTSFALVNRPHVPLPTLLSAASPSPVSSPRLALSSEPLFAGCSSVCWTSCLYRYWWVLIRYQRPRWEKPNSDLLLNTPPTLLDTETDRRESNFVEGNKSAEFTGEIQSESRRSQIPKSIEIRQCALYFAHRSPRRLAWHDDVQNKKIVRAVFRQ